MGVFAARRLAIGAKQPVPRESPLLSVRPHAAKLTELLKIRVWSGFPQSSACPESSQAAGRAGGGGEGRTLQEVGTGSALGWP